MRKERTKIDRADFVTLVALCQKIKFIADCWTRQKKSNFRGLKDWNYFLVIFRGQPPAEADLNLLETARRCELYGIKMHAAKVRASILRSGNRTRSWFRNLFSFRTTRACPSTCRWPTSAWSSSRTFPRSTRFPGRKSGSWASSGNASSSSYIRKDMWVFQNLTKIFRWNKERGSQTSSLVFLPRSSVLTYDPRKKCAIFLAIYYSPR